PVASFVSLFRFHASAPHRHLHSFPTRRSSDLDLSTPVLFSVIKGSVGLHVIANNIHKFACGGLDTDGESRHLSQSLLVAFVPLVDRKSTRLNSSHVSISYAVFCLKKKNKHTAL